MSTGRPIRIFVKDPNDVLDYVLDWGTWLVLDTITTSTWTVPSGITEDSSTNTTTTVTIWLSGGSAGSSYLLVNRIVTAAGRTKDVTIQITVTEK